MDANAVVSLITEINMLLSRNYNMISFSSLTPPELLKLLADTLKTVSPYFNFVQVNEEDPKLDFHVLATEIFLSLETIKYDPTMPVDDFRNGIFEGRYLVIVPILKWILQGKAELQLRSYLAKFTGGVAVPAEMSADQEIAASAEHFNETAEQFWVTYKENNKEKTSAMQVEEITADLSKMKQDIGHLEQRIKLQQEKGPVNKNLQAEIIVKKLRYYQLRIKNLQSEIISTNATTQKMKEMIVDMRATMSMTELALESSYDPIQNLVEQARVNEILMREQLSGEVRKLILDMAVVNNKSLQGNITPFDMDFMDASIADMEITIEEYEKHRALKNAGGEANRELDAHRAQVELVVAKRRALSDAIIALRKRLAGLDQDGKQDFLGGDQSTMDRSAEILQGDNLKQFISDLRERSVIYKRARDLLAGCHSELNIELRTLEIMTRREPTLPETMSAADHQGESAEDAELIRDMIVLDDARKKCITLFTAWEQQRSAIDSIVSLLDEGRNELQALIDELDAAKKIYLSEVTTRPEEVAAIHAYIDGLDKNTVLAENEWRVLQKKLDNLRGVVNRYQMQCIANDGVLTEAADLELKKSYTIKEVQDMCMQLAECLRIKKQNEKDLMEILKTIEMVRAKTCDKENE